MEDIQALREFYDQIAAPLLEDAIAFPDDILYIGTTAYNGKQRASEIQNRTTLGIKFVLGYLAGLDFLRRGAK